MDEQEQQNQNDSFLKSQLNKGKDALKNETKKQGKKVAKKVIIKILANPLTWKLLGILIIVVTLITFLSGFIKIIIGYDEKANDAYMVGVSTNYYGNASTTVTDENGNTVNKVIVDKNETNNGYKISYNNDSEKIENTKEQLEQQIPGSSSEFSEVELGIIGALLDNGADLQYYTVEELHCFLYFIKAEAATQNLDLRPNSEKENGKSVGAYIENYEPMKIEDLGENEVPGVILVQRTNTSSTSPTTLEYKNLSDFKTSVDNNDPTALNYFSIDEQGNLLIAKWEHVYIKVTGEYPQNLDEAEKDISTGDEGRYILEAEPIAYSQYISKFKMPFEFLLQLLLTTEDPNFCMELVDCALDSKIVIDIQEEQTVTVTDETRNYTVHSKENKNINYKVNAAQQEIVKEDNYLLKYAKDDEEQNKEQSKQQNNCTNYSSTPYEVNVYTKHTNHSYKFEIVEADTWLTYFEKKPTDKPAVTHPTTSHTMESKDQYEQVEVEIPQPITDQETINSDNDVTTFINQTKTNYEPKIIVPEDIIISNYITVDKDGNKYKLLSIKYYKDNIAKEYSKCFEIKDEDGNGTGEYNFPETVTVVTDKVDSTTTTKEIPQIKYTFKLETSKNIFGQTVYDYKLQTDIDPLVECIVSSLNIEKFEKIDLNNTIKTTITEDKADSNPVIKQGYYTTDENGNFVKFLQAYDNSKKAQDQLGSIDSWLFEMMENRTSTAELVDKIKYLLYKYDGIDRGVTKLEDFGTEFSLSGMRNASQTNSLNQFIEYLHMLEGGGGKATYTNPNGEECYKVESDGSENGLAVGYGVDIETHGTKLSMLGYEITEGSLIPVDVVDTIEKEERSYWIDYIESEVAELELTQYQIYALASRSYNCGYDSITKEHSTVNLDFIESFKKYYNKENDNKYGQEASATDFNHELYTTFMAWPVKSRGDYVPGLENRRKSEWCLFQTGYYGYDLLYGAGNGIDEYYSSAATDFTNNINLYNEDGSVNADSIQQLEDWITKDLLNTKIHKKDYAMQNGPFEKWWDYENNVFTNQNRFQCTWYAYGRANHFLELYGTTYKKWPGSRGHAGTWYKTSNNGGEKYFESGSEPRPNSIVVWQSGSYGHVAFVEAVDTVNNIVYISHAGSGKSWFGITEHTVEQMKTLWGYKLLGYVYLDSPK